jgi:hypothetical protein
MIDDLVNIADDMDALLPLFEDGGSLTGLFLSSENASTFSAHVVEAKSILDQALGYANNFSMALLKAANESSRVSGPSYVLVETTAKMIRAGARDIQRKSAQQPAAPDAKLYVHPSRIIALQRLPAGRWDFKRLVELCREINVAAAHQCHMSTAMLLRTILNHVPPVLGFGAFSEVANNYGSSPSFKKSMKRLQDSLRNIADFHLHLPIRAIEDLPTATQVDFAADLDVLLGEIIRVSGGTPS